MAAFSKEAKWLWVNPAEHPENIFSNTTIFAQRPSDSVFTVADFRYSDECGEGEHKLNIKLFADTKFRLYVNGRYIGTGPVAAGGDYGNTLPMPKQYINEYSAGFTGDILDIKVQVNTMPEVMTDYSCGRGGFIFEGELDGKTFVSDESWKVRIDKSYTSQREADFSIELSEWEKPYVLSDSEIVWNPALPGIPALSEREIVPSLTNVSLTSAHFVFDRIYSAYILAHIENNTGLPQTVYFGIAETDPVDSTAEKITFAPGVTDYGGMRIHSVSEIRARFSEGVKVSCKLSYVCYPTDESKSGNLLCSAEWLNNIYSTGRFTLEMCRQSLHLDSPLHQETLGCTGDYAIESLMTAMTFGDMRLARLDIIRTADYMVMTNGYMFHTSYSLIWVSMLYEYYMFTADTETVKYCIPALDILLDRFAGYIGPHNVIEKPLNYMFIDWANIDGFQMHHPPMSLGQTSLNAFYFGALKNAEKVYCIAGEESKAREASTKADSLFTAFNEAFYDESAELYYDGFTKDICDYEPNTWLPANTEKRYYTRHCNILAIRYGLITGDRALKLLDRVCTNEQLVPDTYADVQPYFMHYLFEAISLYGVQEKYAPALLKKWSAQIEESPKGMKEGWGEFRGDRSHAWGATPTYHLPLWFSGFRMIEPGFRAFKLNPQKYGLDFTEVTIPTPYGLLKTFSSDSVTYTVVPDCFEKADGIYKLKN